MTKYKWERGVNVLWSEIQKTWVIKELSSPIIDDFLLQDWYTRFYNLNYLTERPLDLEIIWKQNSNEVAQKNIAYNSIMQSLTYYINIEPEDALKIRIQEQESFEIYRLKVEEFKRETTELNPEKFKEAFDDIVKLSLLELNKKLKAYKTERTSSFKTKLVIGSWLLTIWLYSWIIPQNLSEIALAWLPICDSLLTELSNYQKQPAEMSTNPYYFLWKVNSI